MYNESKEGNLYTMSINVALMSELKEVIERCKFADDMDVICMANGCWHTCVTYSIGSWGGGGRSGTVAGRSPGCFFWVLPKRSIPKPDQHRKNLFIQQESLDTDIL